MITAGIGNNRLTSRVIPARSVRVPLLARQFDGQEDEGLDDRKSVVLPVLEQIAARLGRGSGSRRSSTERGNRHAATSLFWAAGLVDKLPEWSNEVKERRGPPSRSSVLRLV